MHTSKTQNLNWDAALSPFLQPLPFPVAPPPTGFLSTSIADHILRAGQLSEGPPGGYYPGCETHHVGLRRLPLLLRPAPLATAHRFPLYHGIGVSIAAHRRRHRVTGGPLGIIWSILLMCWLFADPSPRTAQLASTHVCARIHTHKHRHTHTRARDSGRLLFPLVWKHCGEF